MKIKSDNLNNDIYKLALDIIWHVPKHVRSNELLTNIYHELCRNMRTVNIEIIHTQEEIERIPDLERYTEHRVNHALTDALLKEPVLYEAIDFDHEFSLQPTTCRRFTLPVFKPNK